MMFPTTACTLTIQFQSQFRSLEGLLLIDCFIYPKKLVMNVLELSNSKVIAIAILLVHLVSVGIYLEPLFPLTINLNLNHLISYIHIQRVT